MRTQLAGPNGRVLSPETYNQVMTMHGVTMIFLFVIPMTTGAFGNYLLPLLIGARDMAFPRLNALSYWLFLAAGLFLYSSVFMHRAPDCGWFCYTPLNTSKYDPGLNADFYALGLIFTSLSTTAGAINLIVTTFKLRAPGMSFNRMPLMVFALLAVSFSLIFALPPLTTDLTFLELQRKAGFHFFDVANGGDALLWQHLFWLFGHPEVYIIILPAMGIATSIIPTFSRRKMVAFPLVALAELLVAFIGFGVWGHHMFSTGLPIGVLIFFAAASMMVVVPSTIQIYAWLFTVNMGRPQFRAPLLFIGGFIALFVIGGLSGIMFAAIPFDQATTDTYFVVAHFHFIIFGAAVFPILGGLYYWFPKVTGRMYHERWAQASFWVTFAGTMLTFFPMHLVGLDGMTRRVYTYHSGFGWGTSNMLETIGAFLLSAGLLMIFGNLGWSRFRGAPSGPDPFHGGTLEWTTSSPPPPYNFAVIPTVVSPYPNWEPAETTVVLDDGHETLATTVRDGRPDEVVEMPSESGWPIVLAAVISVVFVMILTSHVVVAGMVAAVAALVLVAWHVHEPELA